MDNWIGLVVFGLAALVMSVSGTPIWLDLPVFALAACIGLASLRLGSDPDRQRILANLARTAPRTLYRRVLFRRILWLQRALRPRTVAQVPRPDGWSDRFDWMWTPLARDAAAAQRSMRSAFG